MTIDLPESLASKMCLVSLGAYMILDFLLELIRISSWGDTTHFLSLYWSMLFTESSICETIKKICCVDLQEFKLQWIST